MLSTLARSATGVRQMGLLPTSAGKAEDDCQSPRSCPTTVRGPRIDHEEVRPWSLEEATTFLAVARAHRLSALFAVGVAFGLRRGELLALTWNDVDLDGGILRVRRTVHRLRGQGLVFGPPKSTRSRRSIPLPDSSCAALQSHRQRQEMERRTAGDSWQESGLVFTTSVGTVVEPRNLSRIFEHLGAAVRRASDPVPRSTPHVCVAASGARCVAPRGDGRARPFSAFDHHGFVLPCDAKCLARCGRRDGSGAERTSMIGSP
jgi:integrase